MTVYYPRRYLPQRPVRDERWLVTRLEVHMQSTKRSALRSLDDFVWAADLLASWVGCDVDVEVLGPGHLLLLLGPECPVDEEYACWLAISERASSAVLVECQRLIMRTVN